MNCINCKGPREHDGTLVCKTCFETLTGIPWSQVELEAHRAVCGFFSLGQQRLCEICRRLESISPSAEVGTSPSRSPVATSANSSEGDEKQPSPGSTA